MTTEQGHPGLYVHVPFCSAKCIYCGFFSLPSVRLIPDWLEALEVEAGLYVPLYSAFDTLYLGGGTPSRLRVRDLELLLGLLRANFSFRAGTEITLEMNPEDARPETMEALLALGVNRLNLGVQSFDEAALSFMGRRHGAVQSIGAIEAARKAGFRNLGLDLIYGLPGQSVDSWLENLDRALEYRPEHLSCYQLTLEPATLLERMVRQGETVLPGEEESRRLFLATSKYLTGAGFLHYEVSNFARGEGFVSRHNSKYWRREPYLGLGPSAHSFRENRRWWNHRSLKGYLSDLDSGQRPLAGEELLSREDVFPGVRLPGPEDLPGDRPGPDPELSGRSFRRWRR